MGFFFGGGVKKTEKQRIHNLVFSCSFVKLRHIDGPDFQKNTTHVSVLGGQLVEETILCGELKYTKTKNYQGIFFSCNITFPLGFLSYFRLLLGSMVQV